MEEKKVHKFICDNMLINKTERIGAAVSGGADSMVMLVMLKNLGYNVCALHFEHGIRSEEESVGDMRFVEDFCKNNGIPFFCERCDVPALRLKGESIETAARRLRYSFFERTAKNEGLSRIATAHHADDNAETVIMNLLRGSGVKGVEGIRPSRGIYVRPMLALSREEIEKYALKNSIDYVTDCTNLESEYTRNKVRNKILPILKQMNPSYAQAFLRASELSREQNDAFSQIVSGEFERIALRDGKEISLDTHEIKKMPKGLAAAVIRSAIAEICPLKDIEKSHYEAVYELAVSQKTGKTFSLEGKFTALVSYNRLIIADKLYKIVKEGVFGLCLDGKTSVFEDEIEAYEVPLAEFGESASLTQYFDADKLKGAVVRTRKEGDMFCQLGVTGSKKLKDWFIDKKVPAFLRDGIPLVARGNDVLWIVGFAVSSHSKVTSETKKIIGLSYRPKNKRPDSLEDNDGI